MGDAKAGYAALGTRGQVTLAKQAALSALPAFGIRPTRLRLLNHGFNTTFRVDTEDGTKYAARVNINSRQTPAKLTAEAAWVEALCGLSGVRVPRPVRTRDGGAFAESDLEPGWTVTTVVNTWLPGTVIGQGADPQRYFELGEMAARLHSHAANWELPEGAEFYEFKDPIAGLPWIMPDLPEVRAAYDRADKVLAKLRQRPAFPIHYDLHPWNIMLCRGKVAIFDFDDAMLGWPELDASVASWYYRSGADARAREARFLEGLGFANYGISAEDYEALVASRQLILLNDLLSNVTSSIVRMRETYVASTVTRLRHYLETGVFDRSVATVS